MSIVPFEKQFARHPKSQFWNFEKNGGVKPENVYSYSHKKFWFDCDNCPHSFNSSLNHINGIGAWCPYCSNPPKKICNANLNCKTCFNKSFASSEKAIHWNYEKNENINPQEVFLNSNNKFWFNCGNCSYSFNSSLNHINGGKWCPFCVNKTEQKLFDLLLPHYPSTILQFKQDWCRNIKHLPFDFCIPEHNIIIELDGRQHFTQVSNWSSPEDNLENDLFKEKCANDNGYSVIRLLQEDVWDDAYDWLKSLLESIQQIIDEKPQILNIYMCENDEYSEYQSIL